jgi:hypothetical protein
VLQELGDKLYTAYFLDGLAAVAGARGEAERAGRLFGAVEAIRESIGAPLSPSEQRVHEQMVAETSARVDAEVFRAVWAAGRQMPIDAAVRYGFAGRREDGCFVRHRSL